jgi:F-box protein 11
VYEYDIPLFNPEPCKFEFVTANDSEYANPWKESFRQLYRGIHVRPGQSSRYKLKGRNMGHFESVQSALDHADEHQTMGSPAIIFLHTGTYRGEFLVIDSDVALIGKSICNFIQECKSHSYIRCI